MRRFIHKPTGKIAEEQSTYYIINKEKPTVPKWIVENGSDWEEIKQVESKANTCVCGCTEYYLSPIVGARCSACNQPLTLKNKS